MIFCSDTFQVSCTWWQSWTSGLGLANGQVIKIVIDFIMPVLRKPPQLYQAHWKCLQSWWLLDCLQYFRKCNSLFDWSKQKQKTHIQTSDVIWPEKIPPTHTIWKVLCKLTWFSTHYQLIKRILKEFGFNTLLMYHTRGRCLIYLCLILSHRCCMLPVKRKPPMTVGKVCVLGVEGEGGFGRHGSAPWSRRLNPPSNQKGGCDGEIGRTPVELEASTCGVRQWQPDLEGR